MDNSTLADLVHTFVHFSFKQNNKGWYPVVCKVCNDHGRKGPRAAFKFDDDSVGYHCFNCGIKTQYSPSFNTSMPEKMAKVLLAYGIPETDWQKVVFYNIGKQTGKTSNNPQLNKIEPSPIILPPEFYSLRTAPDDDAWAIITKDYLSEDRAIDSYGYPFYLCNNSNPKMKKWRGRVIIPIYKGNKIIHYFGRDVSQIPNRGRYLFAGIARDRVIFGFDELFTNIDMPLYIVEGWFDAYPIDGIALLGNEISKEQTAWLNKSPRKKVYIPDKIGDGKQMALTALKLGWAIATPDIGQCKDISEAIKRFGKYYVVASLVEHTYTGFEANTRLGLYCSK